jgi:MFS family permease
MPCLTTLACTEEIPVLTCSTVLTASALMLLFGKFYTFYPPKWVLLIAISLFELGSAICGSAPNSIAFIIGRAIGGLGSSGIFTGALVTAQRILPLHKRPVVMGIMGALFGISAVAGPIIGGALTTKASWRWCFYINLPFGGVAIVVLAVVLKATAPAKAGTTFKAQLVQLDPLGSLCFLPGIVCLILALQWGGSQYSWSNTRIVVLFILAFVLLLAFALIQIWKGELATVPPHVFKQRSVVSGFIYATCNGASMLLMTYYLPIWFQAIKGVDALQSGIDTLAFLLAVTVAAPVAGITVSKFGYYVPHMITSPIFMSIGAGLITTLIPSAPKAKWVGYQVLFGFGTGLGMQQASVAAQTVLAKKDVAIGSALMMFGMQLSGAVFVPVGQNVFTNHLVRGLNGIVGVDGHIILNTGATELRDIVAPEELESVLKAYNKALTEVFMVALAFACLAIIPALAMEWRSVKKNEKKKDKEGGPDAENSAVSEEAQANSQD